MSLQMYYNGKYTSRKLWSALILFSPFFVKFLFDQLILDRSYSDAGASWSLHAWVQQGMMWLHSVVDLPILSGEGLRRHYPSIPQAELSGLLIGGLKVPASLPLFAAIGHLVTLLVAFLACLWVSHLKNTYKLSFLPVLLCAIIVALHPGMDLTWSSYPHYVILLFPIGVAIFGMTMNPKTARELGRWPLFAMGFALSMQYPAAVPCLAMLLALLASWKVKTGANLARSFADDGLGVAFSGAAIALGLVFVLSLVVAKFHVLGELVETVRSRTAFAFVAAIGGVGFWAFLVWAMPKWELGRLLLYVGGWWLFGWAAGTNIFMVHSWAKGLFAISSSRVSALQAVAMDIDGPAWMIVGDFLAIVGASLAYCWWLWIIPAAGLCGLGMLIVWTRKTPSENDSNDVLFLGLFLIIVIFVNVVIAPGWPNVDNSFHGAGGNTFYGVARYFASLTIVVPGMILWLHLLIVRKQPRWVLGCAVTSVLIFAGAVYVQYFTLMSGVTKEANAKSKAAEHLVTYVKEHWPEASITCASRILHRDCGQVFTHDYFLIFYEANVKNKKNVPMNIKPLTSARPLWQCADRKCLRKSYGKTKELFIISEGHLNKNYAIVNLAEVVEIPLADIGSLKLSRIRLEP